MSGKWPAWITYVAEEQEWQSWEQEHKLALEELMRDYVAKRASRQKDPLLDFLFEYYRFRPAQLLRWTPGFGVVLKGKESQRFLEKKGFVCTEDGVFLDPTNIPDNRKRSIRWMASLLRGTAERSPSYGCYGMHEWAMVYRADAVRHDQETLRMTPEEIAAFVDSRPVRCTHFDAWRFFTDDAKPLNRFTLSRDNQQDVEQPGCLHANMDLYKWAYKLFPWVSSALLRDAFELAIEARTIDLQASPYDMRARGLEPIRVETEEGRLLYQQRQRGLYEKSVPVRTQMFEVCERMIEFF